MSLLKGNALPKVKVGLVGGQGYGKTVFLASLLELSHRDAGQCIRLWGSPNARTQKKYTSWLTAFRRDGGVIPTTSELLDVNYVLGAHGSSQWKLQFKDFRGEDLDGDVVVEDVNAPKQKTSDGGKSNVERDKEELEKWLNSCDVLIFLLPVNVVSHKMLAAEAETADVKGEKKLSILNAYVQQIKATGKFACLALNKSDLVSDEVTCEDLIAKVSAIGKFYKTLQSCFGKENVFCHKVSAFGRHSAAKTTLADANAEPAGVAEMLSDVVPRAEEGRLERFFENYAKVGRRTFLARYALVPMLFLGTLKNAWHGIADADRRTKNLGMLKRSGRRFAYECLFAFAVVWGVIVACSYQVRKYDYAKIDAAIANGFTNACHVTEIEGRMGGEPRISMFNMNSILLKGRRNEVLKGIRLKKLEFNGKWTNAVSMTWNQWRTNIVNREGVGPYTRSAQIRLVRTSCTNALAQMTHDAIPERSYVEGVIRELDDCGDDIFVNGELQKAYHDWNGIQDRIEKAKKAADLLSRFSGAMNAECTNLICGVKSEKRRIEDVEYSVLTNALHQQKYADDFNEKTDNYTNRVARCTERIGLIDEYKAKLPNSCRISDCDVLIQKEADRIAYFNKYGPLDRDLQDLLTHQGEESYAVRIGEFLLKYNGDYPERKSKLNDLQKVLGDKEDCEVNTATNRIMTAELKDSADLEWKVRRERIEKRIGIVSNCLSRLSRQSKHRKGLAEVLVEENALRHEIEMSRKYYEDFDSAMEKNGSEKVKAINEVIKDYWADQRQSVPARYGDDVLKDARRKIADYEFTALTNLLHQTMYVDDYNDKTDSYANRIRRSNERIGKIEKFKEGFLWPKSEYSQVCQKLIQGEMGRIAYLEVYGPFDSELKELRKRDFEEGYVKLVADFLDDHSEAKFQLRTKELKKLVDDLRGCEAELVEIALNKIQANDLADDMNLEWGVRLERIEQRIEIVTNYLCRLPEQSAKSKTLADAFKTNTELRAEIERSRKYYEGFDEVMRAEDVYKIKKINEFIKGYGRGQYPNVPAKYGDVALSNELCRVRKEFEDRLNKAERKCADDVKKAWVDRKNAASYLLDELKRYQTATGCDKGDRMREVQALVEKCNRNINFEKDYDALKKLKDCPNAKDLFCKIYFFYAAYPEREWGARHDDYLNVHNMEKGRIESLRKELKGKLNENQTREPLDDAIMSCRKRIKLWEEHADSFIPQMKDVVGGCKTELEKERSELQRLRNIESLRKDINDLMVAAKSLDENEEKAIETFLNGVHDLSKDLPSGVVDCLITNIYGKLIGERDRFDRVLEKRMENKLSAHVRSLESSKLSPEEHERELNTCIQIRKHYLVKLCLSGRAYQKVKRAYEIDIQSKGQLKNENEIRNQLAEVLSLIEGDTCEPSMVDEFFVSVESNGGEDAFPELRPDFARLHLWKNAIQWQNSFKELSAKITADIKGFQDYGTREEMCKYLDAVGRHRKSLGQFCDDQRTSEEANQQMVALTDIKNRAETRLNGLRLWDDVNCEYKKYLQSPSDESYEVFEERCKTYRLYQGVKNSEFENLVGNCKQIEKDRKELEDAYSSFFVGRSVYCLDELISRKRRSSVSLREYPVYRFADDCDQIRSNAKRIKAVLTGYDFTGRFRCDYLNVDFWSEMRIGEQNFIVERNGISGNTKNSTTDVLHNGFTPHQVSHEFYVKNWDLDVKVQFVNKSGRNQWSGFYPRKLVEIFAEASANKGRAEGVKFFDLNKGEYSSVTFSFEGLPYVK